MPKRRVHQASAGSAPPALLDPYDPQWNGDLTAHWSAAKAWAVSNGLFRIYGDGNYRWPDWALMREAGIPDVASERIQQRLKRAGVAID